MRPGTAVPASEQINKRIANNFQYIQEVHAHLAEIMEVASHLTPVEDLVMFQGMVEDLHQHLGLLVDAAEIIVQITEFGFDLIRADDPAAARALLELGSAALKDESFFAKADEFATLYAQVQAIADEVIDIQLLLPTLATKVELTELHDDLMVLITALEQSVEDLDQRIDDISNTVTEIGGDLNGIVSAVSQLQTDMVAVEGGAVANATAITSLQAGLEDVETGVETNATAINTLTTEVSVIGDTVTSLSSDVTALSASITGLEEGVEANGTAISELSTQVTANEAGIEVLSTSVTSLNARVDNVEEGLNANVSALEELTVSVEENAEAIVLEAEQRTQLEASLTGGGNQLPNTNFEAGVSGWTINQRGAGWNTATLVVDPIAGIVPENRHTLGIAIADGSAPVGTVSIVAPNVAVTPGKEYFLSGYFAADKMTVTLEARWLDATGALISSDQIGAPVTNDLPGSNALNAWDLRTFEKVVAPGGARTVQYRVLGSAVTLANPRLAILSPMVEEASEKQNQPSPWSESGIGFGTALATAVSTLTAMISESDGDITALAAAVTALDVRVDDVESDVAANAGAISSLTTTVTTLQGTVTAQGSAITAVQASLNVQPNMLPNPTFRTGLGGWTYSKTGGSSAASAMGSATSPNGTFMSFSAVGAGFIGFAASAPIAMGAGTVLSASVEMNAESAVGTRRLMVLFYNSSDVFISEVLLTIPPVVGVWSRAVLENFVSPAGTGKVRVRVRADDTTGTTAWRKVKLEFGAKATLYDESAATTTQATATNLLDARVTAAEGNITSTASATTALAARIGDSGNLVTTYDFTNGIGSWAAPAYSEPAVAGDIYMGRRFVLPPNTDSYQDQAGHQKIPVTPGEVLDLQANMKCTYAVPPGGFGVAFLNEAGSPFQWAWIRPDAANVWQTKRDSVTVPANAVTAVPAAANNVALNYFLMTRPSITRRSPSDSAAATAISTLNATVTTQGGQITANASAITALNTTVGGNVSAISALQLSSTGGANLLGNTNFRFDLAGWGRIWAQSGTGSINEYRRGIDNSGNQSDTGLPNEISAFIATQSGNPGVLIYGYNKRIPVAGGKRYCFSAYMSGHPCHLWVQFQNAAGSVITEWGHNPGALAGGGRDISNHTRAVFNFVPPAGTVMVRVGFMFNPSASSGSVFTRVFWPQFEQVPDDQTGASTYSPSGAEYNASYTLALDVNGYASGFRSSNNGQTSNFDILADNFRILKPGGGARTEFSSGNWRVYDGAGTLRVRMGIW